MSIPKLIHFIAPKDSDKWHPYWKLCYQSWLNNFSDFKFKIWTDKQLTFFIKKNFPEYFNSYKNLLLDIYKYDFARLCIMYEHGGIYSDIDIWCYRNFYNLLQKECCIVGNVKNQTLTNSLFCSVPKNTFFKTCIKNILLNKDCFTKKNKVEFKDSNNNKTKFVKDTIKFTGPGMISSVYKILSSNEKNNIEILDDVLYDGTVNDIKPNQITLHLYTSMWGKETLRYLNSKYGNLEQEYRFLAHYNNLHFNQSNSTFSIFTLNTNE